MNKPGHGAGYYQVAFVYLDKTVLPYAAIEEKLKALTQRLGKQRSKSVVMARDEAKKQHR